MLAREDEPPALPGGRSRRATGGALGLGYAFAGEPFAWASFSELRKRVLSIRP